MIKRSCLLFAGLSLGLLLTAADAIQADWAEIGRFAAQGYVRADSKIAAPRREVFMLDTATMGKRSMYSFPLTGAGRLFVSIELEVPPTESEFSARFYFEEWGRGADGKGRMLKCAYPALKNKVTFEFPNGFETAGAVNTSMRIGIKDRSSKGIWFKKIEAYFISEGIEAVAPRDGAVVNDNTPDFYWRGLHPEVTLQLSQQSDFSEPRSYLIHEQNAFELTEKLAPGTWYWRVITPDGVFSKAFRFEQTAPLEKDCAAPRIMAWPSRVKDGSLPLEFEVQSERALTSASAQMNQVNLRVSIQGGTICVFPPKGKWPLGVSTLKLRVENEAKNIGVSQTYVGNWENQKPVTWDSSAGVTVDGAAFYPIGLYIADKRDFAVLKKKGINFVQNYQVDKDLENQVSASWLNDVDDAGLKAMAGVNWLKLKTGDFDFIARRIGAIGGHPALLAWYLADEPDMKAVSPKTIQRAYQLIHMLNPERPVLMTCCMDGNITRFSDCFDVYMPQGYYGTPLQIATQFQRAKDRIGSLPLFNIASLNHRDETALISNAILAMGYGSGLMHWWWVNNKRDINSRDDYFSELSRIVPFFAAPGQLSTSENDGVHRFEKRSSSGARSVLILNATESPVRLKEGELAPHGYKIIEGE